MDYNTIALLALIFMVIIVIVSWWLLGTTLEPNPIQQFKLADLEPLLERGISASCPDQFKIESNRLGPTLCHYFGAIAWAFAEGREAHFESPSTESKIVAALPLRVPFDPTLQAELHRCPKLKSQIASPLRRETAWATNCGLLKGIRPLIQPTLQTAVATLPVLPTDLAPDLIIYLDQFEPILGRPRYIFQRPQWYNYALAEVSRRLQRSLAELKVLILFPDDPLCTKMVTDLMAELTIRNVMTLTSASEDDQFRLMLAAPAVISSGGALAYMAAWGSSNLMITPDLLELPNPHCRENWLMLPSNPIDPREVSTDSEILIVADKLRSHLKRRQSSLLGTLM